MFDLGIHAVECDFDEKPVILVMRGLDLTDIGQYLLTIGFGWMMQDLYGIRVQYRYPADTSTWRGVLGHN